MTFVSFTHHSLCDQSHSEHSEESSLVTERMTTFLILQKHKHRVHEYTKT